MDTTFIYTLSDPDTGLVRYVGKSNNPKERLKKHFRKERTKKWAWINSLLKQNKRPLLEILDEVSLCEWQFWEQFWIQFLSGNGCPLVNGDGGGLGRGRTSFELRSKLSQAITGKEYLSARKRVAAYTPEGRFVFEAASRSEAANYAKVNRANISRAISKNTLCGGYLWVSVSGNSAFPPMQIDPYKPRENPMKRPEVSEKVAAHHRGKVVSEETRLKQRMAKLGRRRKLESPYG